MICLLSSVFGAKEAAQAGPARRLAGSRAEQADQRLHDVGQLPDQFQVLPGVVLERDGRKLGLAGVFGLRRLPARDAAWFRRQIEQRLRHQHAGLPVHRGMMDLDVVGHIAVIETIDHRDPPQRTVAVEQLRMQLAGAVFELRLRSGAGEREALHVIVQIDLIVLDPDRVGELQRHRRSLRVNTGTRWRRLAISRLKSS